MSKRILISRPLIGREDPTYYTFNWSNSVVNKAKSLGYKVITIDKDNVNKDTLEYNILKYKPALYIHYGHGCPTHLIGQDNCIVSVLSDNNIMISDDRCQLCSFDNTDMFNDMIMLTYSCHSAKQLGKHMAEHCTYIGFDDYLLFLADNIGSDTLFGNALNTFAIELLFGNTVQGAFEKTRNELEKLVISYKDVEYISTLAYWDMEHLKVYGDSNITI